jgi:hypothetical protein
LGEFKQEKQILSALSFRHQAEANIGRIFFFHFQKEAAQAEHFCCQAKANTVRAFFYAIKQRQILAALSFTLSSLGKNCPRILFPLSRRGNTGRAFFFIIIFLGFFFILYSALLRLPPLRFPCADGCWDRTQDCCNWCIGSQLLSSKDKYYFALSCMASSRDKYWPRILLSFIL